MKEESRQDILKTPSQAVARRQLRYTHTISACSALSPQQRHDLDLIQCQNRKKAVRERRRAFFTNEKATAIYLALISFSSRARTQPKVWRTLFPLYTRALISLLFLSSLVTKLSKYWGGESDATRLAASRVEWIFHHDQRMYTTKVWCISGGARSIMLIQFMRSLVLLSASCIHLSLHNIKLCGPIMFFKKPGPNVKLHGCTHAAKQLVDDANQTTIPKQITYQEHSVSMVGHFNNQNITFT